MIKNNQNYSKDSEKYIREQIRKILNESGQHGTGFDYGSFLKPFQNVLSVIKLGIGDSNGSS